MPRSLPPSSRTSASTSNPALPALFARSVKSEIITWLSSTTPTASAARCPPPTSLRPSTVSSKSCGATAAATSIPKTPGSSSSVWPSRNSKPDAGAASPPPSRMPSISSTPSFSHDSRPKNESLRHKILDKCRHLARGTRCNDRIERILTEPLICIRPCSGQKTRFITFRACARASYSPTFLNQLTQTLQFHIGALLKLQVIQNSLKFLETQLSLEIVTQQHKKVNKAAYMAMGNDSISCCVLDSILNHLPNFFLTKLTAALGKKLIQMTDHLTFKLPEGFILKDFDLFFPDFEHCFTSPPRWYHQNRDYKRNDLGACLRIESNGVRERVEASIRPEVEPEQGLIHFAGPIRPRPAALFAIYRPFSPSAQAQQTRYIFKRLCVAHTNAHSAFTFSNPRSENPRNPRPCLICPNTGSTIPLRAA